MPTILACTDGSTYARSVYDHSVWAARRLGAEVRVLHMLEHPEKPAQADISGTIGIDTSAELLAQLVTLSEIQGRLAQVRAVALLAEAQRQITSGGVDQVFVEQRHGALVDSIGQFDATADLVIIGKRGEHAGSAKLHLGSNLERVVRTCRHPVLVVPDSFQPIDRFLLAYDGSPSVQKAVAFVLQNPLLHGLHCHLVRAGKIDDQARYYLEETAGRLRAAGLAVTSQCTSGPAEDVIAAAVNEQRAQLLVMGAYGHSRIRQLIIGSTTTTLIRTVHVPVLLFR